MVRPDIVKLDAAWAVRLMESQSGFAMLKETVERVDPLTDDELRDLATLGF